MFAPNSVTRAVNKTRSRNEDLHYSSRSQYSTTLELRVLRIPCVVSMNRKFHRNHDYLILASHPHALLARMMNTLANVRVFGYSRRLKKQWKYWNKSFYLMVQITYFAQPWKQYSLQLLYSLSNSTDKEYDTEHTYSKYYIKALNKDTGE